MLIDAQQSGGGGFLAVSPAEGGAEKGNLDLFHLGVKVYAFFGNQDRLLTGRAGADEVGAAGVAL